MSLDHLSDESISTIAESYRLATSQRFREAADLAIAVRVLHWFKESGDAVRNISRREPLSLAALTQRKALLDVAYKVLEAELDHTFASFTGNNNLFQHYSRANEDRQLHADDGTDVPSKV